MKMKKIILIILISFFVFGCRTKRVSKNETKIEQKESNISKTETVQEEQFNQSTNKESSQLQKETKSEEKKEIEIKGKAEENKPLTYYNVVNGDTIDLFKVTGNAEVIFKSLNTISKIDSNIKSIESESKENKAKKSNVSIVEKASNAVSEVKNKTVEVVKKDFTFGTYLTFFLWGILIIVIIGLIYYFRKSNFLGGIWERLNKKR